MDDLVTKGDFPKGSSDRLSVDRAQLTVLLVKMTDAQLDLFIDRLLDARLLPPEPYRASRCDDLREGSERPAKV